MLRGVIPGGACSASRIFCHHRSKEVETKFHDFAHQVLINTDFRLQTVLINVSGLVRGVKYPLQHLSPNTSINLIEKANLFGLRHSNMQIQLCATSNLPPYLSTCTFRRCYLIA